MEQAEKEPWATSERLSDAKSCVTIAGGAHRGLARAARGPCLPGVRRQRESSIRPPFAPTGCVHPAMIAAVEPMATSIGRVPKPKIIVAFSDLAAKRGCRVLRRARELEGAQGLRCRANLARLGPIPAQDRRKERK